MNLPDRFGESPHRGRLSSIPLVVQVANPAAGADWSLTVPGQAFWEIQTIYAKLTTSATVANRLPALSITESGVLVYKQGSPLAMTAGAAWDNQWAREATPPVSGATAFGVERFLPHYYLRSGSTITVTTGGIQVGDQWSAIALYLIEWEHDAESSFDALVAHSKEESAHGIYNYPR